MSGSLAARLRPSLGLAVLVSALACSSGGGGSGGGGGGPAPPNKLTASGAAPGDNFGISVSVFADVTVVGTDTGTASVYRWDGMEWVEEQILVPSDGAVNTAFGSSVAVDGDVIAVGAPQDDEKANNAGAVYVFRFDGVDWLAEQKILASDGFGADLFGNAVSVSADAIAIGAVQDDDKGFNSGSAYVFRFDGVDWIEEQKLVASDGRGGDQFGLSVSIDGDVIAVGANQDDSPTNSGSAYVFGFNGASWIQEDRIVAPDAAPAALFGFSVAVSGDVVVVGAPGDDDLGVYTGSAYTFAFNGANWVFEQKLLPADAAKNELIGNAVAVEGDVAVIGVYQDDDPTDAGSAYVYVFDGASWVEDEKLRADDLEALARFGSSVSISGAVVVIGAYHDGSMEQGAAYAFD